MDSIDPETELICLECEENEGSKGVKCVEHNKAESQSRKKQEETELIVSAGLDLQVTECLLEKKAKTHSQPEFHQMNHNTPCEQAEE